MINKEDKKLIKEVKQIVEDYEANKIDINIAKKKLGLKPIESGTYKRCYLCEKLIFKKDTYIEATANLMGQMRAYERGESDDKELIEVVSVHPQCYSIFENAIRFQENKMTLKDFKELLMERGAIKDE